METFQNVPPPTLLSRTVRHSESKPIHPVVLGSY